MRQRAEQEAKDEVERAKVMTGLQKVAAHLATPLPPGADRAASGWSGGINGSALGPPFPTESQVLTQQLTQQQQQQVLSEAMAAMGTLGQRERLRGGVFRPGHILPSMTVEEFGEQEIERMREQEAGRREAEAHALREEVSSVVGRRTYGEDSREHDDDKVMRQRAQDDWKDNNPYGHGNSALRPCGR